MTEPSSVPDVRKKVTVEVPAERAFAVFAEYPLEWFPEAHVFVKDRVFLAIEPRVGGRYYERGADGTEIAWGTVLEWDPPRRIVLTWRVGANWQPVFDDEKASLIKVDFEPVGPSATRVSLTHADLHRHGEAAAAIYAALNGPDPGETLERYREVVRRHSADSNGADSNGVDSNSADSERTGSKSLDSNGAESSGAAVTLLNSFTVSGSGEAFEKAFHETSAYFAQQPGFIEHSLLKKLDEPGAYVNVARWTDQRSLRQAVARPEFQQHEAALRALAVSNPKLFSVCFSTEAQAA
ncbi:MAG TPA: SRPBCC domain-containing protein [Actinocrinis sp.]|uniref:SRPBCC domain-containing protein n=1 Tax=Actinocrinis sp. TaxID=1920516 RepID=UPI002D569125|nr:SRPBCC domain-containing protein [Actinocrinis sp.]HZU56463.1 SRPBCC domain-containing protein [Actinocrinis sp.]